MKTKLKLKVMKKYGCKQERAIIYSKQAPMQKNFLSRDKLNIGK